MKQFYAKILMAVVLVMSTLSVYAQQLPDPGFEDWSGAQFDSNIQPKYWHGSNVEQVGFKFNFTTRETGRSGYAIRVANTYCGAFGIGQVSPGYFSLGNPWQYIKGTDKDNATGGTDGGINMTYRPDSMYVWIKRTGNQTASENYTVLYYSWKGNSAGTSYKANANDNCTNTGSTHTNEESDIRQTMDKNKCGTTTLATQIAEGFFFEKKAYSNWTQIKVPIYYFSDEIPEKCNVIISSSGYPNFRASAGINEGSAIIADDVELIYSSTIQKLYIGNKEWKGFKPNSTEVQTYSLGEGATVIPDIFAVRGAGTLSNMQGSTYKTPGRRLNSSECEIKKGTVDGELTTITVKSGDGKSTTTYKIKFVSSVSNNARLADIRVNGQTISGFNTYLKTYNIALPYGTTATPVVEATPQDATATVEITQPTSVNGKAKIEVTAQDGTTQLTYELSFSVAALSDATLKNIFIDGNPLPGFQPSKATYNVSLPLGTTSAPKVTWESAYPAGAQIITLLSNTLDSGAQIKVTLPNSAVTKTYKLTYKIEASSYSYLNAIMLDDVLLEGFEPEKTAYTITLPLGTTKLPEITWTKGDSYQTVQKIEGGIDGVTRIGVTAASGATTTYRLTFKTEKSTNNALAGIAIDGAPLDTFHPDTLVYTVTLSAETTTLPTITYTTGDAYQTVAQSVNPSLMTVRLTVTAGDGSTRVYTVAFEIQKSANALLRMIYLNGEPLDKFESETLDYSLVWTEVTMPKVTVLANPGQLIAIASPASYGTIRIVVTPEEGAANTYTVQLNSPDAAVLPTFPTDSFPASKNAQLAELYIGGVQYADFVPTTYSYTYNLSWRTYQVPAVMAVAGGIGQTITIEHGAVNRPTLIKVLAADKTTTQTYTIDFRVPKSNNTKLESVEIDGVDFTFNPDVLTYTGIALPYGTSQTPALTAVRAEGEQSLKITEAPIGKTSTIEVTAEDGTKATYSFAYVITPPDKANELLAISLDGIGALDLSQGPDFAVNLPFGTTELKIVSITKNYPEQEVKIVNGGVSAPTTITVKSLNPAEADKVYTITPNLSTCDPAMLTDIKLDGVTLPNFKPEVFNYVVSVEATPAVTYTEQEGAEVDIDANSKWAKIHVVSGTFAHTYLVTFYYPGDVTFDLGFENWISHENEDAGKSGSYPKGWNTPLNAATTGSKGTYNPTGVGETNTKTQGSKGVDLSTVYLFTSAESMPGFLSLSPATVTVGAYKIVTHTASTLAYGSPITFRNTPDQVQLDYNLAKYNKLSGWRFIYTANGEKKINYSNTFSSITKNTWFTLTQNLSYGADYIPATLDILISSANTDDLSSYYIGAGGTKDGNKYTSTMYVDNLRLNYSSVLNGLTVNGADATKSDNAFTATVDADFGGIPALLFNHAVVDQMPVVEWQDEADGVRTATITNYAEDLSTTTYTLTVTRPKSANTTCTYTLSGRDLTVVKGSPYQTVAVSENDTAYVITVTAESGAQHVYYASLIAGGSEAANVTNVAAEEMITGVSTACLVNLVEQPIVNYDREFALDSVVMITTDTCHYINVYGMNEYMTPAPIRRAINGTSKDTTYIINRYASKNALLDSIKVNGLIVPGFYEQTFDYVISMPSIDAIDVFMQDADADAQYTIVQIDAENAAIFVYVTAPDGQTQTTYSILVHLHPLGTDAYLTSIMADGVSLTGFQTTKYDYSIELPAGSAVPQIASIACEGAYVETNAMTVGSVTTIAFTVTSEDEKTQNSYAVQITILPSEVSTLDNLFVNNAAVEGFNSDQLTYNIELPYGTTDMPSIDYVLADKNSTATVATGEWTSTITVTAEDGVHTTTYTLVFTIAKSTNAALAAIFLDGNPMDDFYADEFSYTVQLPYGADVPVITAQAADATATVEVNGNTIVVTAEDGVTKNTYTVEFVHLPSTNAVLQSIELDGVMQQGFEPEIYAYEDTVLYGAPMPVVTWTVADEQQKVDTTWVGDTELTIVVTAGDGETTAEYTLTFIHLLSSNWYLSDLQVRGVTIDGFRRDSLSYTIIYPVGTDSASLCKESDIVAVPEESDATVSVSKTDEVIQIFVTAPDGTIGVYTIDQTIMLSSEARLSMIWLDEVELADFDKDVLDYSVVLAQGASLPEITASPVDATATSEVGMEADIENGKSVEIYTTAQDGTTLTYTIQFLYANWAATSDVDSDDYLFFPIGNGQFKAVTISIGVKLGIYDMNGHLVQLSEVPVADPADVEVDVDAPGNQKLLKAYSNAAGVVFEATTIQPFIYVFYNSQTKRVGRGGKFEL